MFSFAKRVAQDSEFAEKYAKIVFSTYIGTFVMRNSQSPKMSIPIEIFSAKMSIPIVIFSCKNHNPPGKNVNPLGLKIFLLKSQSLPQIQIVC